MNKPMRFALLFSLLALLGGCNQGTTTTTTNTPDSTVATTPPPSTLPVQQGNRLPLLVGDLTPPKSLVAQGIIPLVDAQGRQLILNGLNSGSGKDAYLRRFWEQPSDLQYEAVNLGYNAFRYLIAWDQIMPQPGVINEAYLDDVASRVQWLADQGFHVILDMHQDNWSHQCGGNGAPDWASVGTADEPPAGAPWWIKAASPCVVDSVNNFFYNQHDVTEADGTKVKIQDEYAKAWLAVAQRFQGNPAVLGYDLMNEPTITDAIVDQMVHDMLDSQTTTELNAAVHSRTLFEGLVKQKIQALAQANNVQVPDSYVNKITDVLFLRSWGDWGQLKTVKYFEGTTLTNLYQNLINTIRTADPNHYIFVEGFSVSINNGAHTYLGHLNDPRGSGTNRRLGYIPHTYPRDLDISGVYKPDSFENLIQWARNQHDYVSKNQMAWMTGEFGLSNSADGAVHFLDNAILMMENYQLSWTYWDSTPGTAGDTSGCINPTTCTPSAPGSWGPMLINPDGSLTDAPNAAALVNMYPRAVAGDINYYHYDRDLNTFTLIYTNNTTASGTTDIAVPPRFLGNGLVVQSSDPDGSWSYTYDAQRSILHITADPESTIHKIEVHPANVQPLTFRELRNARNNKCLDYSGVFPTAGTPVIIWTCGSDQTWQHWAYNAQTQQLISLEYPDLCIDHGDATNAANNGKVTMQTCAATDNQRWILDSNGTLHDAFNPTFVLDAYGDSDGATAGLWTNHNGLNQHWNWGSL